MRAALKVKSYQYLESKICQKYFCVKVLIHCVNTSLYIKYKSSIGFALASVNVNP